MDAGTKKGAGAGRPFGKQVKGLELFGLYGLFSKSWALLVIKQMRHLIFWGTKLGPTCWELPIYQLSQLPDMAIGSKHLSPRIAMR